MAFVKRSARAGVLTWKATECGHNVFVSARGCADAASFGLEWVAFGMLGRLGGRLGGGKLDLLLLPPIQFGDIVDSALCKPLFVAEWDEEVNVLVLFGNLEDCRVAHVVVVVVADDHSVNEWDILHLAGHVCVSLGTHEAERATSGRKYRVEQDSEAAGELDMVASMAQPGRAQILGLSRWQEVGLHHRNGGWCGIRTLRLSTKSSPSHCAYQLPSAAVGVGIPWVDEAFAMLVVVSLLLGIRGLGGLCAWRRNSCVEQG